MARPRKAWSYSYGRYGAVVRIFEPRPGAPLRWDYRDETGRHRPEVFPEFRVRYGEKDPVDPVLADHAKNLCEKKSAELKLTPVVEAPKKQPYEITIEEAFAMYHDPKRAALPESKSARTHQETTRDFFQDGLGKQRMWNDIPPADVWGLLLALRKKGQVASAVKRLQNLRTVTRWLQKKMRIRGLEDPTDGLEVGKIEEGYKPRRPRLTRAQLRALRGVLTTLNPRTRLFLTLMLGSGTRAVQARNAMRSGLDAKLEVTPEEPPPFGWFVFKGVKGQRDHVIHLTWRMRLEITRASWKRWDGQKWVPGWLAEWEGDYPAKDYPLAPGGRFDRDEMTRQPINDRSLRYELDEILKAAGIDKEDRMGFHAIRRGWAQLIRSTEGLDTTTAAGGWDRRETVEESYTDEVQHGELERARKRMEEEEGY